MKRFVFPFAVALCFLALVALPPPVSAKDTWVSVRTNNFFMIGNADEKEIRKVALRLEQFREVFTHLFPNIRFNTPVPTTVVVFKSDSSFAPFKPGANIAGYFQAGDDVNYIALTTELQTMDPFNVIFHEYTHLLVNNTFKNAPVWFNEGLAEYYSTFKITDDQKIALGVAIGNHVHLLRENKMLPLRTLFQVDHKSPYYNEGKKQSIFYAQSWALMHYLLIGKAGKVEKLGKFMDLVSTNVPMETAFQQAFEVSFEDMEKELRNYVKQDRYNFIEGHFQRKLELDVSAEASQLTEAEVQAYLGDLLWHSHRVDAIKYLEKALKLDPNLAMAHASLGMVRFYEGKVDEARAILEHAVAANSQNYLVHYYYAFTLSRRAPDDTSSTHTPEEIAKIRDHLQRAIALRPDFPESYDLLAFVSMFSGKPIDVDEAIASMKRVLSASPGRARSSFMLAQLYLHKQDYKAARPLLEELAKSTANEGIQEGAQQMLAGIDSYEKQVAEAEGVEKAAQSRKVSDSSESEPETATTRPTLTTSRNNDVPQPASDPSSYLREILRTPGAGETQLQTTLVRIDCDAKGMIFVVRTATGELHLHTKSFDDIELTTYSPDVKGDITCGPRKPENAVIVCYLPNADKRVKADGILKSIEFVPTDFKLKPVP